MIEQDNTLTYIATCSVVAVLATMYVLKDTIRASIDVPDWLKMWTRNRWLRLIGREEYKGRHRYA